MIPSAGVPRLGRVRLALAAAWWILRVEWLCRRGPIGEVIRKLGATPVGPAVSLQAERGIRAVRRIYRLGPLRATCLKESLAAVGLLRQFGGDAALAIGVKPGQDPLDAHAWVEIGGLAPAGGHGDYVALRLARGVPQSDAIHEAAFETLSRPSRTANP